VDVLIFLVFGFALVWLFILMPQRRRATTQQRMIDELKPGDYVVTAGGLYGTVADIGEDDLGLEVAPGVEVRVAKRAIGAVIPPDEIEEVEEDEDEVEEPFDGDEPDKTIAEKPS
jgi:preprotein translocase subunit YajC